MFEAHYVPNLYTLAPPIGFVDPYIVAFGGCGGEHGGSIGEAVFAGIFGEEVDKGTELNGVGEDSSVVAEV